MSDKDTPATPAETPVVPAATPGKEADGAPVNEETVSLKKADYERMQARQSEADKRKAELDRKEREIARRERMLKKAAGDTTDTPDDVATQAAKDEDAKAERMLLRLGANPKYRAAIDADPTFRDMLLNNPLSLLPTYAKDAFDAEDAVSLIEDELSKRLEKVEKKEDAPQADPKDEKKEDKKTPEVPPKGGVNLSPPEGDATYDKTLKEGSVADAIAYRMRKK